MNSRGFLLYNEITMDSTIFSLRLTGIILQIIGGIVGSYWLMERLLNYPPLVSLVSWLAAGAPEPQEMILKPNIWRIYVHRMKKTYRKNDNRHSILNPVVVLHVIGWEVYMIGMTWGWIAALILTMSGKIVISVDSERLVILVLLFCGCLLFDLTVAFARVRFSSDIGIREFGSKKTFARAFANEFSKLMCWEPVVSIGTIVALVLLLLVNWFTWITRILPKKYRIDLNRKRSRQSYYATYAFCAFLIGSCMLLASMLIEQ